MAQQSASEENPEDISYFAVDSPKRVSLSKFQHPKLSSGIFKLLKKDEYSGRKVEASLSQLS